MHNQRELNLIEKTALGIPPSRAETIKREYPRISRNDLCYCGSNKKYKKCCLISETLIRQEIKADS